MSDSKKQTTTQAPKTPQVAQPTESTAVVKRTDLETELLDVAQTFGERQQAFELASRARQIEMIRKASIAIAEKGWGKDISEIARAAVARYCYEIGADPVRHVYVLSGNVYLNAEFYKELCAANPDFLRPTSEFIHDDERADADERARRKKLRVEHGVPEGAPGACIVTLYYRGDRGPFVGVNWAGVRSNDPVGKQDPTKTAETRAYRKAALKAEPAWFRVHPKLARAELILTQGRLAPHEPEEPPAAIGAEDVTEIKEITPKAESVQNRDPAPAPTAEPEPPKMANHNPSAKCKIEGPHPLAECGYEKGAAK